MFLIVVASLSKWMLSIIPPFGHGRFHPITLLWAHSFCHIAFIVPLTRHLLYVLVGNSISIEKETFKNEHSETFIHIIDGPHGDVTVILIFIWTYIERII